MCCDVPLASAACIVISRSFGHTTYHSTLQPDSLAVLANVVISRRIRSSSPQTLPSDVPKLSPTESRRALAVARTTCVGSSAYGRPSAIAQLPNGGKLYVIDSRVSISVLDPSGSTVLSTISPGLDVSPWYPTSVTSSLDGNYVFVLDKTRLGGRPHYAGVWIITTSNDMVASLVGGGGHPNFSVLDTRL